MNKTCVFKCHFNGKWYRVYEYVRHDTELKIYYRACVGRRRLDNFVWRTLGGAIGSIIMECGKSVMDNLIDTWS